MADVSSLIFHAIPNLYVVYPAAQQAQSYLAKLSRTVFFLVGCGVSSGPFFEATFYEKQRFAKIIPIRQDMLGGSDCADSCSKQLFGFQKGWIEAQSHTRGILKYLPITPTALLFKMGIPLAKNRSNYLLELSEITGIPIAMLHPSVNIHEYVRLGGQSLSLRIMI